MNSFSELKQITTSILTFYGYFAANEIWDFACKHNQALMISFVLGMESNQITNEFTRMLEHNDSTDDEFDSKINAMD